MSILTNLKMIACRITFTYIPAQISTITNTYSCTQTHTHYSLSSQVNVLQIFTSQLSTYRKNVSSFIIIHFWIKLGRASWSQYWVDRKKSWITESLTYSIARIKCLKHNPKVGQKKKLQQHSKQTNKTKWDYIKRAMKSTITTP